MLTYLKNDVNRFNLRISLCRCKICITVLSDICLSDILLHFTTGRAIFDKFSISQCTRIEKCRVNESLMNFIFSETSVCLCQEIQNEFSCRFKNFRPSFTLLTVIFVQFFLFSLKNSVQSRFLNGFLKIFIIRLLPPLLSECSESRHQANLYSFLSYRRAAFLHRIGCEFPAKENCCIKYLYTSDETNKRHSEYGIL